MNSKEKLIFGKTYNFLTKSLINLKQDIQILLRIIGLLGKVLVKVCEKTFLEERE